MDWLFNIAPNGDVTTLYTETVDLRVLGELEVSRASNIEYDHAAQGWAIVLKDGTILAETYPSREDALAAEVAYIQAHWDAFVGTAEISGG